LFDIDFEESRYVECWSFENWDFCSDLFINENCESIDS